MGVSQGSGEVVASFETLPDDLGVFRPTTGDRAVLVLEQPTGEWGIARRAGETVARVVVAFVNVMGKVSAAIGIRIRKQEFLQLFFLGHLKHRLAEMFEVPQNAAGHVAGEQFVVAETRVHQLLLSLSGERDRSNRQHDQQDQGRRNQPGHTGVASDELAKAVRRRRRTRLHRLVVQVSQHVRR